MKRFMLALFSWAILLGATFAAAEPMTLQDIVRLAKAELKDATIISQIIASSSKFEIKTDDIIYLKENGVSEDLISFLINTPTLDEWREIEDQAAKSDAANLEDYVAQTQPSADSEAAVPDTRTEIIYRSVYFDSDFWLAFHPYSYWRDIYPIGFYYYCGRYHYYFGCHNWQYHTDYPDGYYANYRNRYKPPRHDRHEPRYVKGGGHDRDGNQAPREVNAYQGGSRPTKASPAPKSGDYTRPVKSTDASMPTPVRPGSTPSTGSGRPTKPSYSAPPAPSNPPAPSTPQYGTKATSGYAPSSSGDGRVKK